MELVSAIIKGKQDGLYTLAIFIDLSKAFDTVDHGVLLNKLYKYGIRGVANQWFQSYLTDRKMRVKCNISSTGKCESSDYRSLSYGAPQGSCLGPLIFLIFTNDLHQQLENSSSILFADDTTLYKMHRILKYLKWCLEEDLTRLSNWFKANKLTMNVDKTVCVLFQKNNKKESIKLKIDSMLLSNANEVKFLGMWLDENLSWTNHINKLILKISRNSNLIKYSKNKLPKETKVLVYHAHIGSHIQYGITLWGNSASPSQIKKVQKIQNNCIKFIMHNQSKQKSEKSLQILPIDSMIVLANYRFGYKLLHNLLPKKTSEICLHDGNNKSLLPNHKYQMRSRNIPNLPKHCSNQYKSSFLCKGPRSILTLNVDVRNKPTLKSFSKACKKLLLNQ